MCKILLNDAFQSTATKLLEQIPDIDIWEEETEFKLAEQLWKELMALNDIGPTIAGKILSRKRPGLIPIYDSKVDALLCPGKGKYWASFKAVLCEDGYRRVEILKNIRESAGLESVISILRTIDVIAWMTAMNPKSKRGK